MMCRRLVNKLNFLLIDQSSSSTAIQLKFIIQTQLSYVNTHKKWVGEHDQTNKD